MGREAENVTYYIGVDGVMERAQAASFHSRNATFPGSDDESVKNVIEYTEIHQRPPTHDHFIHAFTEILELAAVYLNDSEVRQIQFPLRPFRDKWEHARDKNLPGWMLAAAKTVNDGCKNGLVTHGLRAKPAYDEYLVTSEFSGIGCGSYDGAHPAGPLQKPSTVIVAGNATILQIA